MEHGKRSPDVSGQSSTDLALLDTILGRPAEISPDDLPPLSEQDPEAFEILLTVREIGDRIKTGDRDGQGSRPQDLRAR